MGLAEFVALPWVTLDQGGLPGRTAVGQTSQAELSQGEGFLRGTHWSSGGTLG